MVRPTYEELTDKVKVINKSIIELNNRISLADNAYELADLTTKLDSLETELMIVEDYIERTISRGRE